MDIPVIFKVIYRKVMRRSALSQIWMVFFLFMYGVSVADDRASYSLSMCDPVSYQVADHPEKGREDLTYPWGGQIWAFSNEGNLEAFKHAPEVYAPLFQGCDVLSLAQGYRTEGLAKIYLVYNHRLLLFHSREHRALFLTAPDKLLAEAQSRAIDANCGPYR